MFWDEYQVSTCWHDIMNTLRIHFDVSRNERFLLSNILDLTSKVKDAVQMLLVGSTCGLLLMVICNILSFQHFWCVVDSHVQQPEHFIVPPSLRGATNHRHLWAKHHHHKPSACWIYASPLLCYISLSSGWWNIATEIQIAMQWMRSS